MMLKNQYLTVYNLISIVLWCTILYRLQEEAKCYYKSDSRLNYERKCLFRDHAYDDYPHKFLVKTQIFNAIVEIANTSLGLIRSPIATVLLQYTARLVITLGVSYFVPLSPGNFLFRSYGVMTLAWSLSEIIRCVFYVTKLQNSNKIPYYLKWLRYSSFIVLYPVGLMTELSVVYETLKVTRSGYRFFLLFVLTAYIPGFLILYVYMFKQRSLVSV